MDMDSYLDTSAYDIIEGRRNIKPSVYELIESEDESIDIQNPFLQKGNPLFENNSSAKSVNILREKSETKNIEPIKQAKKSEKKEKEKLHF